MFWCKFVKSVRAITLLYRVPQTWLTNYRPTQMLKLPCCPWQRTSRIFPALSLTELYNNSQMNINTNKQQSFIFILIPNYTSRGEQLRLGYKQTWPKVMAATSGFFRVIMFEVSTTPLHYKTYKTWLLKTLLTEILYVVKQNVKMLNKLYFGLKNTREPKGLKCYC